ncbi:MAG: hypothetical protein RLP14_10380 [Owenweeksia sp.]
MSDKTKSTSQSPSPETKAKQPNFRAFRVDGQGKNANWTDVGAMWKFQKGVGYTLILKGLERDLRIVLLENKQS